jgi:catechol 2,3-dioxygenase-like lactoylglutathione lyase family enzyme
MWESAKIRPTIAVSDLERAKKYYEGTLGLRTKDARSDGTTLENDSGDWLLIYPSQFAGTNKATYASFEVDDLEKAVAELRERGVTFEEYDFPANPETGFPGLKTVNGIAEIQGVKGAWFKDPDGNILSVGEFTG